jgi:biotin transport system substrate-specific component
MQQVLAERIFSRNNIIADIALIVLGSLVVAGAAQISIPLQPVPITGQTFAVLLVGMALGARRGALALALYLAEGIAGLPVFTAGQSGLAYMLGPTGGYLVGFIPAAALVGWLAERGFDRNLLTTLAAMVAGNLVIYAFGLAWLTQIIGSFDTALSAGMYPFLLGDAIKAVLAALLLPAAWKLINR